ncbi:MAG: hypothetical protein ABIO80_07160 [Sphingomicrobium sp.]
MTDRGFWMTAGRAGLNVRWLMYQSLIRAAVFGDDPGGLRPPFDTKDLESLANALVDSVGGNIEPRRNLFGQQVLIDQPQAIELTGSQPFDPRGHCVGVRRALRPIFRINHDAGSFHVQFTPPGIRDSTYTVAADLRHTLQFSQFSGHSDTGGQRTEQVCGAAR